MSENRSQFLPLVLAYLRERGLDTTNLVAKFALMPAEVSNEVVAPFTKLYAFLDEAERLAGDPFLGVHVAESRRTGSHGLLEYCWRNAPTIGHAMTYASENWGLFRHLSEMRFQRGGGKASFTRHVPESKLGAGRHGNEFFVCSTLVQMRELSGDPFLPNRAVFSHPRPKDVSEIERVVGVAALEFDAEYTGIEFDERLADLPIRVADAMLFEVLKGYVERLSRAEMAPASTEPDFVGQLRQAVRVRLPHGEPALSALAAACSLSERTLQRRLSDSGTSLLKVIDSVREEEARRILKTEDVGLADLASRIGYQDTRSLIRAFKRWTGTTPRAFKEQSP